MSELEFYAGINPLPHCMEDKQVRANEKDREYVKRLHEAGEAEQNHIDQVKDCGGWPILEDRIRSIDPNDRQVGGNHYKGKAAQPWDLVDGGPAEHAIGYYRWNALKYIARAGDKGDIYEDAFLEDIEKAEHYIQKLIHFIKNSGPKV